MNLPLYISHKQVHAAKIDSLLKYNKTGPDELAGCRLLFRGFESEAVDDNWIAKHGDGMGADTLIGGYFVRYADGYTSWSPAEAFEKGYTKDGKLSEPEYEEIEDINRVKELANNVGTLVDDLYTQAVSSDEDKPDVRWIAIGKAHLQQGFMAIVRAIAKPDGF